MCDTALRASTVVVSLPGSIYSGMSSFLFSAVVFFAFFSQSVPNLNGTWKLDQDASTGPPIAKGASILVITQSGDDFTFDYYASSNGKRGELIQTSAYSTDGRERRGNKIRTYVTYVRSYWHRSTLVMQTRNVMDLDGYQTFNTEDRWTLSEDGKTLTDQSSDGTKAVYVRQPDAAP